MEVQSVGISPRLMYSYRSKKNIPWNITEYDPVREYLDPNKSALDRKYQSQKRTDKNLNYVTKKGFYMDYMLKVAKTIPAPNRYNSTDGFDQSKNKEQNKKHKRSLKLKKYTYIDLIEQEQKSRAIPSVGIYNLDPTQKQIQENLRILKNRKRKIGQKRFFYQDSQHLSNIVPGAGNYHPHDLVQSTRINKTNPKIMIQKHKKQANSLRKKRKSEPDPGSYHPIPVDNKNFDRISKSHTVAQKRKKYSMNGFGSDAKFPYDRPKTARILEKRPEPTTYDLSIEWKGKQSSQNKGWSRSLSMGFTNSIYK